MNRIDQITAEIAELESQIAALKAEREELRSEVAAADPEPTTKAANPSGLLFDNITESEIAAPNGVVFRLGDRVTFGQSNIVRVIMGIHGGRIRGVREDGGIQVSSKWTAQLNRVKHVYN